MSARGRQLTARRRGRALATACGTAALALALACRAPVRADAAPKAAPSASAHADAAPKAAPSASAPVAPDTSPAPSAAPSVAPAPAQRAAAVEATPGERARRTVYRVAAIGDSLTDYRSNGGLYLRYLAERCPESRFDSWGKGGEMVNQMRRRFARDVLGEGDPTRPRYTHVIVFGGVNDLYSDLTALRTVKKIESDLSSMYAAAHAHGMKVVALTVTPWGGFHRYYNPSRATTTTELNRWIVAQRGANAVDAVVDANPLLSCGNPEELCPAHAAPHRDGLHFGPGGHHRIAEALYREVFSDCR